MVDDRSTSRTHIRRASPTGIYVAIIGIVLFNISPFLDWFTNGDGESYSGYEGDSLIPFVAYLGVGLAIALLFAQGRAERRQHRGLSLATMAVGIAASLQALATILDVPGALERGENLDTELGVYVALLGAVVWAIGAAVLAKEPEGDPELDRVDDGRHEGTAQADSRRQRPGH